jgi:hypothetical protein
MSPPWKAVIGVGNRFGLFLPDYLGAFEFEGFSASLRCFMIVNFPTDFETTICSISPVTLLDTFWKPTQSESVHFSLFFFEKPGGKD